MSWTGPGFVDAHTHLLWSASGSPKPFGESSEDIRKYHERIYAAESTPTDFYFEDLPENLDHRISESLNRTMESGVVGIHAMNISNWGYVDSLSRLREEDKIPIQVRLFISSGAADLATMNKFEDETLEIAGVKFYCDGWLGSRTCAVSESFEDEPKNMGLLFLDSDTLARRAAPFAEAGWTIATHAIGDRAVATVVDAYEKVYGADCRSNAPRIEHCAMASDNLIERIAEMGIQVCMQPSFAKSDNSFLLNALGSRTKMAYQWRKMYDMGVQLISGTDFPIETADPLEAMRDLATGPADSRLSIAQCLEIMTRDSTGTMTLDKDPSFCELDELINLKIESVQRSKLRA